MCGSQSNAARAHPDTNRLLSLTQFLTHTKTVLQANPSVLLYTPIEDLLRDKDGKPHEPTAEEKEAQKEEIRAVAAASAGKHDEALETLNAVIGKYPEYASAYNNRYTL